MGVKLVSSGGGSVEINPPATASSFTATMPAGTGTVAVNGVSGTLVSGTAVASTSGTAINFTGIPSWVKRVTVLLSGVSTNGATNVLIQLGTASGLVSTGYVGVADNRAGTGLPTSYTSGLYLERAGDAGAIRQGAATFQLVSGTSWVGTYLGSITGSLTNMADASAAVTLGATLTQLLVRSANGTDTFDAGSINILYE